MPSLSIQTPGTKVSLKSDHLLIMPPEESELTRVSIPIHDIDRVTLAPRVGISSSVILALLKRRVPIDWVDWNGSFLGSFQPPSPPRANTRLSQYHLSDHTDDCLTFSKRLIVTKIRNERRILQRLLQRHCPGVKHPVLSELKRLTSLASSAATIESLRGFEGISAKTFMAHWANFLPTTFPFERRSIRPPLNPVNSVVSYLSAIIYGELLTACYTVGLDPSLGFFHQPTDNRFSLPLDLMEPFRPALIYPLALRFFGQGILQSKHFQQKHPGVWLNSDGKSLLHLHFEKLLLREFFSQHLQHRTTLRLQLQKAPLIFKTSLRNPSLFLPFQLNGTSQLHD